MYMALVYSYTCTLAEHFPVVRNTILKGSLVDRGSQLRDQSVTLCIASNLDFPFRILSCSFGEKPEAVRQNPERKAWGLRLLSIHPPEGEPCLTPCPCFPGGVQCVWRTTRCSLLDCHCSSTCDRVLLDPKLGRPRLFLHDRQPLHCLQSHCYSGRGDPPLGVERPS